MELSKRLAAIAEMVGECESMADIGTDHGYIPIYLIEQKRAYKAVWIRRIHRTAFVRWCKKVKTF